MDGFQLINIKEQNISAEDLDRAKAALGSYEALFSKRAMKFRQQGLHEKTLTDLDYRDLILGEYTFLKRPVYFIDEDVFAGNAKKTVEQIRARLSE